LQAVAASRDPKRIKASRAEYPLIFVPLIKYEEICLARLELREGEKFQTRERSAIILGQNALKVPLRSVICA